MGIVGSQIEVEWVFNIVGICTNLQQSWFGMDNLEMFINIYKNDAHVNGFSSMDKFMEMEETLMDDNEEVITSLGFLDIDEGNK